MPRLLWLVLAAWVLMIAAGSPLVAKGARGGGGRGGGSQGGGSPRTPAATPTQDPASAAALTKARDDLAKASKALDDASDKLVADFEQTPDVVAAKKAVADALAAVAAARAAVVAKLAANPEYKSATDAQIAGNAQLDKLRAANADPETISAKATEVFKLGNVTGRIEREAVDADPGCKEAQTKLAAANAALADLRSKFKESLKTDPQLATLRQARDDAQTALNAAQAKG